MFGFNRKKSVQKSKQAQSSHSSQPQSQPISKAIESALMAQQVNGKSLSMMLTKVSRQGDSLTLDMSLPQDANPEAIQQSLGQALYPHGIHEINMNITLQSASSVTTNAN